MITEDYKILIGNFNLSKGYNHDHDKSVGLCCYIITDYIIIVCHNNDLVSTSAKGRFPATSRTASLLEGNRRRVDYRGGTYFPRRDKETIQMLALKTFFLIVKELRLPIIVITYF